MSMIKVFVCNVKNLELDMAINNVSSERREKINKFHFLKDKKLSCGAELLLNKVLSKEDINFPEYAEDYYKKPFIKNYDMEFNLSHSKEMVACAVSDNTVGVDIEYIDKCIDLDIAKHYFYNNEYENIMQSTNKANEFFKYWVLKESFMKYTSLGFNINLDEFNIKINEGRIDVLFKNREKIQQLLNKNSDRTINLDNIQFKLFKLTDYMLATSSQEVVKSFKVINVNELY